MNTERVDVLIIGLGPAGGSAAAVAACAGLKVLAIDRKRELGLPVQCAEYIPAPLGRYARAPGVLVQTIAAMRTLLPSSAAQISEFGGLMIDRARFDRALADRARDAGAEISPGWSLTGLDAAKRCARLQRAEQTRLVRYTALIAADGPHSSVARMLGLSPLTVLNTRQYRVALNSPSASTDVYLSAAYPGGYAWLFPKSSTANLGLGFERGFGGNLRTALDQLHTRLSCEGRVGTRVLSQTGGAIPVSGLRAPLHVGRIAFAGDAGGFTHPISGAGIAASVISGRCAAEVAARACERGAADFFAAYEEEMRELFQASFDHALGRRRELIAYRGKTPVEDEHMLRRGWIAFDHYHAEREPVPIQGNHA